MIKSDNAFADCINSILREVSDSRQKEEFSRGDIDDYKNLFCYSVKLGDTIDEDLLRIEDEEGDLEDINEEYFKDFLRKIFLNEETRFYQSIPVYSEFLLMIASSDYRLSEATAKYIFYLYNYAKHFSEPTSSDANFLSKQTQKYYKDYLEVIFEVMCEDYRYEMGLR